MSTRGRAIIASGVLLLAACPAWTARAQGCEYYLMSPDVGQGFVTNATHRNWIELAGWGYAMPGLTCTITKRVDLASPSFAFYSISGYSFHDEVRIDCVHSGTTNILYRVKMEDVAIDSVRTWTESSSAGSAPFEEVQFHYGRAEWTCNRYDPVTGEFVKTVSRRWP